MRDLIEMQRRFGAALAVAEGGRSAPDLFRGDADAVRRRFAIYRGNARATAAKALLAAYPVIGRLVGEEFFSGLAREYETRFPSASGDLNEFGGSFAAFLADFAPAREIPYLADVARLEWQVHSAHYAADAPMFDPAALIALSAEEQLALRPRLHPACRLIRSDYPLERIWAVNQPGFEGDLAVDFSRPPANVLVYRPRFRVEVRELDASAAAFLAATHAGGTLEQALAAAQSRDISFDLAGSLLEWVGSAIIVDFSPAGGTP
ncbi:MAG TPA: DNA-binding domain-containing protein [Burkholderiales bacterium]|nr:DNA-binding domain-containing protein [Burkholderiales bacterium]